MTMMTTLKLMMMRTKAKAKENFKLYSKLRLFINMRFIHCLCCRLSPMKKMKKPIVKREKQYVICYSCHACYLINDRTLIDEDTVYLEDVADVFVFIYLTHLFDDTFFYRDLFMNMRAEKAPVKCEVTNPALFDPMLEDTYDNLPPLR